MERQVGIEPEQLADTLALLEIHRAGDEAALTVDLAVVEARAQFAGLGLVDAGDLAAVEVEEMETASEAQTTAPPVLRSAIEPIGSGTLQCFASPPLASQRWTVGP